MNIVIIKPSKPQSTYIAVASCGYDAEAERVSVEVDLGSFDRC